MAFKFYIDNQLTDQPDNDMDLVTTIKRDRDLGGMFITQEVTLAYSGNNNPDPGTISGYSYLKSKFDSGSCNEVDIVIYDEETPTSTVRVFTGVIKVPSMKIDEQRIAIELKIDDNSFYSYIKNNGNIKFNLYANKTKNGQPIQTPQIYTVDMFQSEPFSYLNWIGNYYQGYRLYDVLRFIVPAISDNKVTFYSDYLQNFGSPPDSPNNPIEFFLFDGYALSHANSSPSVQVSFNQIIKELFKAKDTFFYIDQSDPDAPVLRLEHISWFYLGSSAMTFSEPLNLKSYVDETKLYGTVKVGASYNPGGAGLPYSWVVGTSYYGWDEEIYTPFGQCNINTELDLINEFYVTSNAINDQVIGAIDANNDNIFMVECAYINTGAFTAIAVAYETYSSTPATKRFYNIGLNNVNKLNLHGSNFHAALTNTQVSGSDICRIETGQDEFIMDQTAGSGLVSTFFTPITVEPITFSDELGPNVYDPGGNYDNLLYHYNVPIDGNYSFGVNLDLQFINFKDCQHTISIPNLVGTFDQQYGVQITISIKAYTDNTFTTLVNSSSLMYTIMSDGTFTYGNSLISNLSAGNTVRVETSTQWCVFFPQLFGGNPASTTFINAAGICPYSSAEPKAQIINLSTSSFECNGTPDGTAIVSQPALALFKNQVKEFVYDISPTDFINMRSLPFSRYDIIKDGNIIQTWIDEVKHSNWTGRTQLKLISSNATT